MAKNKRGRTVWFERGYPFGLVPVTLEGFALTIGAPIVGFGLVQGGTAMLRSDAPWMGLAGLAAWAAFPVLAVIALVIAVRHSGPHGSA